MKNTETQYGYLTIFIHWLVALVFIVLFALGYWMVDLGYYHQWYQTGPNIHKSMGILLFVVMVFRLILRAFQIQPKPLAEVSKQQNAIAHIVHLTLYILLFVIFISGYLISTADDRNIEVFSWFEVPALGSLFENQEDIAGSIHKYVAYGTMALVVLHAFAALKHHFINKDKTLIRMLGKRNK